MTHVSARGWRFLYWAPSAIGNDWGVTGSVYVEPRDCWVGAYWTVNRLGGPEVEITVYFCLLPCLPIRFHYWRYSDEVPF